MDIKNNIDNFDILEGVKNAIANDNLENLHYMTLYEFQVKDHKELDNLVNICLGIDNCFPTYLQKTGTRCFKYLLNQGGGKITEDQLKKCLGTKYIEDFEEIVSLYLEKTMGRRFDLDNATVNSILIGTEGAMYKLQCLDLNGFKVPNLEQLLIDQKEGKLLKPSCTRHIN